MGAKLMSLFLILFQTSRWCFSQEPERAILQGTLAKLGQFPYVVHIETSPMVPSPNYYGSRCTGAILTEHWVVTGSHCYTRYALNNIKLTDVATEVTAGIMDVDHNTTHTQYRLSFHHVMMDKNPDKKYEYNDAFNNDVLILKVVEPFVFNAEVGAITIAKRPLPEGKKVTCIVVGYGLTEPRTESNKKDKGNSKLYYTYATLDGDKFSCRKRAEKRGYANAQYFGEENICMDPVDYRSTPCNGDSGGPLVCDGLDIGTSVGRFNINNKDPYCGNKGNYHVYTFLGFYEDWLKEHVPELPPFKLVKAGSSSKKGATSGCGDTRFRVTGIGLAVFIYLVPVYFNLALTFTFNQICL